MFQVSVVGSWALVTMSGEFDAVNSDGIRLAISELVDQGITDVTVDLSLATFLSAATLNALVAARNRIVAAAGRLAIVGVDGFTTRVLDAADLAQRLSAFSPTPVGPELTPGLDGPGQDDPLVASFYQLSLVLLREPTVTGDFEAIVRAATATVPECCAASISLLVQGEPRSAVVNSRIAIEVDLAQYWVDEGPCLSAARSAQRIRVDVLDTDERFRHFAPMAIEAGVHATLSAPITAGGQVVGSLNLYSDRTGAFDQAAEATADLLAAQAATAIDKNEFVGVARRLARTAQGYSDDRSDIRQADGALSALHRCSVDQAHHLLHSHADANHETLVHAAQRILASLDTSE